MKAAGLLVVAGVYVAGYSTVSLEAGAQAAYAGDIAHCAAISGDNDRLLCYDQLARETSMKSATPIAPPLAESDQTFGINKPLTKISKPSRMESSITEVASSPSGIAVLRLENNQTWELEEGSPALKVGDHITVNRAALGSFLMTTPTGRVYRARRLR